MSDTRFQTGVGARFHILDTGLSRKDPYVIVDENEKVLAASYEENGEHSKAGLLKLTDEIATLRAQLAEARDILIVLAYIDNMLSPEEKHEFVSVSIKTSTIRAARAWYNKVITA